MKRFGVALAGFAFGLFLTWLCLYSFSRINWPVSSTPARGCYEIDHCPTHWWTYPTFFGTLLGPSLLFGFVNALAWKRWTLRRWAGGLAALTLLTVAFYLAGHVLPSLR